MSVFSFFQWGMCHKLIPPFGKGAKLFDCLFQCPLTPFTEGKTFQALQGRELHQLKVILWKDCSSELLASSFHGSWEFGVAHLT